MKYFRFFLLFFLLFLRCNTINIISNDFTIEIPEVVIVEPPLSEDQIEQVENRVTRQLDNMGFNGNVLVAYKGYPIVRYSNGYRHFFKKEKLNPETAFQLASVSKAFTAMAILMLQQKGKLDISDSVFHYISEFPYRDITIQNLLQHTSGLQNYMYFVDGQWDKEKHLTYDDVLDLLVQNSPQLSFRPGQRHYYSNTGYAMLALLVEKVSGMPFDQFMKINIFDPLDMQHTFVWNRKTMDTISNIATGFKRYRKKYASVGHDPLDEIGGDKSVYSTIDDLMKWELAWSSNQLISDSLIQLAFTKTVTGRNRIHDYGLGWRFTEIDDKPVIYHNGLWNGFTTSFHRFISDSIIVIVLNNTNGHASSVARQIYVTAEEEISRVKKEKSSSDNLASLTPRRKSN